MRAATFGDVEYVVRTIAATAVQNEKYFGDLDAVVGDGDFGYSMARGFELVLAGWDDFDRTDIGTFLKKVAVIITSRIGGTSGPIWGTASCGPARPRAPSPSCSPRRSWPCCGRPSRASRPAGTPTSATRRCWTRSSRRRTRSSRASPTGWTVPPRCGPRPRVARESAEATRPMQAMRGRASYTGERSIGTLDAGAIAVAVMFEALAGPRAAAPA